MRVAIIGAGGMGGGLAKWLARKHEVSIGSRDKERGVARARELGAAAGGGYADAAADAEVVFLTVPWTAVDDVLAEVGNLSGKVLVDVTNPFVGGNLQLHVNSSNAEEIQRKVPEARVVKGWNTVYSPIVNTGADFAGAAVSVFLAGDDPQAKEVVSQLASDIGFDPIDCGPLSGARDLEGLMEHLGTIGQSFEWGSWSLKVLRR
jgi:8-hydroxy-5-deazaflavin:NADPH oxidoreductase